jgi:hypothetical protein
VIQSGTGGWKFIDVVSPGAGKLESLEYVRQAFGFPLAATVGCGDSGNDILMLSGPNRAIVVGNAEQELAHWAAEQRAAQGPTPATERLYIAQRAQARAPPAPIVRAVVLPAVLVLAGALARRVRCWGRTDVARR